MGVPSNFKYFDVQVVLELHDLFYLLRKHNVYDLKKEHLLTFCNICVEGLYATPPEVLLETLEGFIKRYFHVSTCKYP